MSKTIKEAEKVVSDLEDSLHFTASVMVWGSRGRIAIEGSFKSYERRKVEECGYSVKNVCDPRGMDSVNELATVFEPNE